MALRSQLREDSSKRLLRRPSYVRLQARCASERRLDRDVEFIHENFRIPVTAPWLPYWLSIIILFRFAFVEAEIRDSKATLAVQAVGSFALLIPPGDVRSVAGPSGDAFRLLPEASRRGY
jgi:hypothetical protein